MDLVYLGGVPEAGKTLIGKSINPKFDFIKYINGGVRKHALAREIYKKDLSVLNQKESQRINGLFLDEIIEADFSNKLVLIDSHYTCPLKNRSFVRLIPERLMDNLGMYILVCASPDIIVNRRVSAGKLGIKTNLEFVKMELLKEEEDARKLSRGFLESIDNSLPLDLAVDNLEGILRRRFPDYFNVA